MSQQQQWEATHAWEPITPAPFWVRQKYPSMDFKKNDYYILKGKKYHYRVRKGLQVERSLIGRKGLVGQGVPKKKFLF